MNNLDLQVNQHFDEHLLVLKDSCEDLKEKIIQASQIISQTLSQEGTIYWIGNGGSCADAQHLAAEFTGKFQDHRKSLNSISLTADTSVLTCIANDYSYSEIFSRQIEGVANRKDLIVVISTSGNSQNLIKALKTSNRLKIKTLAILGKDGGECKSLADFSLVVPSKSTARIQEIQILIGHIMVDLVEKILNLKNVKATLK